MNKLYLLWLISWLLPLGAEAQLFNKFEPGSYVLTDNQGLRLNGQLKLRDSYQLLIKNEADKTLKFSPEQVASFCLGNRKFVVTNSFHVRGGIGGFDVNKPAFVEQLDSGQIVLSRFSFQVGAPGAMSINGTFVPGSNGAFIYLLRWSDEETPTPVQSGPYSSGGKQFREALRPFLIGRPELIKLLDDKRIGEQDIPALVKSLNHNLPFNPPVQIIIPSSLPD